MQRILTHLYPRRWLALALLAVSNFMVIFDASIMNVSSPTIRPRLPFSKSGLPWVVNAYVLVFGGLLLVGGRLADRFGSRAVLLAGVGVFAAASLGGGLATGQLGLVAARAGQGLAAALLAPAAMNLLVI